MESDEQKSNQYKNISGINAIKESIIYLYSSAQAGRIFLEEAKYQKDGTSMQLMSLSQDELPLSIEKKVRKQPRLIFPLLIFRSNYYNEQCRQRA